MASKDESNNHIRRSSRSTRGKNTKLTYEQELENEVALKRKLQSNIEAHPAKSTKKAKTGAKGDTRKDKRRGQSTHQEQIGEDQEDERVESESDQPLEDSGDEFIGSDTEANTNEDENLEETVRCLVCGTTDDNYDEDTDKLGLMVECSKCQTWQHAKCMLGHKNPKKVPDDYVCNVCDPTRYPNLKPKVTLKEHETNLKKKPTVEKQLSFNKIRLSVGQTFHKLFVSLIPKYLEKSLTKDEIEEMAQSLSIDLEKAIYNSYTVTKAAKQSPGQKYAEKSRSLYSNLKDSKNVLFKQILENKLTLNELTLMSPQELLNPDLQKFSKQVMEKAIHDSVLKPMQKPTFRKTHKGDEAVEDEYNNDVETSTNVGLVFNHAEDDEYKAKTDDQSESGSKDDEDAIGDNSTQPTDVEDHDVESVHRPSLINLNSPIELEEGYGKKEEQERKYEDVGLDDDLDNILNDDKKSRKNSEEYDPSAPSGIAANPDIWEGELTFPGICNFQSKLTFLSTTNSHHSFEKEVDSMKMILDNFKIKNLLEIEGRLSFDKAIVYLTQILKSRYLDICDLTFTSDESNYQRLFQYFNNREKVGVIVNRPTFLKDCYLLTFSKAFIQEIKASKVRNQSLNTLFNAFKNNIFDGKEVKDTILLVFVVKHNFENEMNSSQTLKKLPNNFYKLSSVNQQKFMEIVQMSEQKGRPLSESDVENLVRNLLK